MGGGPKKAKRGTAFHKLQSEREEKGVEEDLGRDEEERQECKQIRQEEREERQQIRQEEREERKREREKARGKEESSYCAKRGGSSFCRLRPSFLPLFTQVLSRRIPRSSGRSL